MKMDTVSMSLTKLLAMMEIIFCLSKRKVKRKRSMKPLEEVLVLVKGVPWS